MKLGCRGGRRAKTDPYQPIFFPGMIGGRTLAAGRFFVWVRRHSGALCAVVKFPAVVTANQRISVSNFAQAECCSTVRATVSPGVYAVAGAPDNNVLSQQVHAKQFTFVDVRCLCDRIPVVNNHIFVGH